MRLGLRYAASESYTIMFRFPPKVEVTCWWLLSMGHIGAKQVLEVRWFDDDVHLFTLPAPADSSQEVYVVPLSLTRNLVRLALACMSPNRRPYDIDRTPITSQPSSRSVLFALEDTVVSTQWMSAAAEGELESGIRFPIDGEASALLHILSHPLLRANLTNDIGLKAELYRTGDGIGTEPVLLSAEIKPTQISLQFRSRNCPCWLPHKREIYSRLARLTMCAKGKVRSTC